MDILIKKPIITERSLKDASLGIFTFEVNKSIDKRQIKMALENLFHIHVKKIATTIIKGKTKLAGKKRKKIRESDRKIARVKLKSGEKIDLFEINQGK